MIKFFSSTIRSPWAGCASLHLWLLAVRRRGPLVPRPYRLPGRPAEGMGWVAGRRAPATQPIRTVVGLGLRWADRRHYSHERHARRWKHQQKECSAQGLAGGEQASGPAEAWPRECMATGIGLEGPIWVGGYCQSQTLGGSVTHDWLPGHLREVLIF